MELEEKVKAIVAERLGKNADQIKMESSFTDDLGADSLDTVELVMKFEEAFSITIPDEDAAGLKTVGDAVSYLNSKKVS